MPRAKSAGESLGAARTAVEGDPRHFVHGLARYEEQAAHASLGGDSQIRQQHQVIDALKFDRRDDGDLGAAIAQIVGALRGNGEGQFVLTPQRPMRAAVHQRSGIEVLNDGDAELSQDKPVNGEI